MQETVGTLCADTHPGAYTGQDAYTGRLIPTTAHTLRAEGFDASEDGTGRGTPLVPVPIQNATRCKDQNGLGVGGEVMFTLVQGSQHGIAIPFDTTQITSAANYSNPKPGDPCHPLAAGAHPPAIAIRTANTSANGHGISPELAHTLDQAQGQAVAFAQNTRDEVRLIGGDGQIAGALPAMVGMKQQTYIAFSSKDNDTDTRASLTCSQQAAVAYDTLQPQGITGEQNASVYEADAASLLRTLRDRIGAEAVAEWGSRILDSLQSPEVLRAWLHGASLRCASGDFKSFVDDCPLPREEGVPARTMRDVWENGPDGRTSQGRGLAKQLAHQLGKTLPQLPCSVAPSAPGMQVRRLTPTECERLMGFPDSYTLIPWKKKPADACPDGPRYKALGNSWAVPVARWVGERISEQLKNGN